MRRMLTLIAILTASLLGLALAPTAHGAGTPPKKGTANPPKKGSSPAGPVRVILPAGWPKYLVIPKIGVKAPVEATALNRASDVHAPFKWGDVAWYNKGPRPGELGRAALFGHLDSTCCPAVFWRLGDLKTGDTFTVQYKKGRPVTFKVMWNAVYPNNRLPVKFLFGEASERGISLITCTGIFHTDGGGYDHKRVAYARLLLPNGKLG